MKQKELTKRIVTSGILLALGFVLSFIKIKIIPAGGSFTLVSMLPIVMLGYRYGPIWGTLCGFAHAMLQIVEDGLAAPPVGSLGAYILVFLLDYALAWSAVGLLSGLVGKIRLDGRKGIGIASVLGIMGRFVCNFLSGVLIWGIYAPEGQSAVVYSLVQNALVLVPEMLLTAAVAVTLCSFSAVRNQIVPRTA